MRLVAHPATAVLAAAGRAAPRVLRLTDRERRTLEAARRICESAADLIGEAPEDTDTPFLDAEARLADLVES